MNNQNDERGERREDRNLPPRDLNIPNLSELSSELNNGLNHMRTTDEGRYCWVCFATEEDDALAMWVQPCECRGTTKWVHQTCLQRWIDEKQKGNTFKRVNCPQCQTEYIIVFPQMGIGICILEGIDAMIKRLSPYLAAGIIVGSLYWAAVTYGAVTVLQVVGAKEGLSLMEAADPLVLVVGLPAIPAGLVLGRMIRWEDMILRFLQNRRSVKLPLLSLVLPIPGENNDNSQQINENNVILSDPISVTRILCGALLLPTISSMVGRLFFDSVQNNLQRTIIGGVAFIAVKGVLKVYYKQQQFYRNKRRNILDYNEENLRRVREQESSRTN